MDQQNNGHQQQQQQQQQQQMLAEFENLVGAVVHATETNNRCKAEESIAERKEANILLYLECLLQLTIKSTDADIREFCIVLFRVAVQPSNVKYFKQIPEEAYDAFQNGLMVALNANVNNYRTYVLICDAIGTLGSRLVPKGYWKDLLPTLFELTNNNNNKNANQSESESQSQTESQENKANDANNDAEDDNGSNIHIEGFLRVLEKLAEYSIEFLEPNFAQISHLITCAIQNANPKTVIASLKTLVSICMAIKVPTEVEKWQPIVIVALNLLDRFIDEEVQLQNVLALMIDLFRVRFLFIQDLMHEFVPKIATIVRNQELDYETRKLGLEMLVLLPQVNGAFLRKHEIYLTTTVHLVFQFLSFYDDDIDFNVKANDNDQNFVEHGRQAIFELVKHLGAKTFLVFAMPMIQSGLQSITTDQPWKECYAALQVISHGIPGFSDIDEWKVAEECETLTVTEFESDVNHASSSKTEEEQKDGQHNNNNLNFLDILVINLLKLVLNHPRAEIKHLGLICMKRFVDIYKEAFVSRYFLVFYLSMLQILQNYEQFYPKTAQQQQQQSENESNENTSTPTKEDGGTKLQYRVLTQAVKCIAHFNQHATQEQFRDKSDAVLQTLAQVIVNNEISDDRLKGYTVTAIGTCAYVLKNMFLPYYDKFMGVLMSIIKDEDNSEQMRGKAMEAIGMIGESVGNQRFSADAHRLMSVLLPYRDELLRRKHDIDENIRSGNTNTKTATTTANNSGGGHDDSHTTFDYLNRLFARICRTIGADFTQYFAAVLPPIIAAADITAATVMTADEASPADPRFSVVTVHIRSFGDTKFCINPFSLQEKQSACHMLYQFAKDQPLGYFAYVNETAEVILPLLRYAYSPKVRDAAACILPHLLKSAVFGVKHSQQQQQQSGNGNGNESNSNNNGNDGCNKLLAAITPALLEALLLEGDVESQICLLEILGQMCSILWQSAAAIAWEVKDAHLLSIAEVCCAIFTESQERGKNRFLQRNNIALLGDIKLIEDFEWETDVESELIAHIIDVVEYTYKAAGERFSKFVIEYGLVEACFTVLNVDQQCRSEGEILQAICLMIDCLEMGGAAIVPFLEWFYPILKESTQSKDCDIQQTSVFGIGVIAQVVPDFNQFEADLWLQRSIKEIGQCRQRLESQQNKNENNNGSQSETNANTNADANANANNNAGAFDSDRKTAGNENENGDADEDEYDADGEQYVYENWIGTYGKILRYHILGNVSTFASIAANLNDAKQQIIMEHIQNWICLLPTLKDEEEYNNMTDNILYLFELFGENTTHSSLLSSNMTERMIYSLLFYESQCLKSVRTYDIIMREKFYLGENAFPTDIPMLNDKNIGRILSLKNRNEKLSNLFGNMMMNRFSPSEIQNIQAVENRFMNQQQQ